ncbi:fungal-specific transcription factor domain-containing protein [Astrocystis sublimbata]|nr:fungal-specific transcription factor domain-containing protein [Astrocystis sublimbata]
MNGPKLRSSQGCWTCRLRRKKCDEARPVCVACGGLEIDCHYSDAKPEWMDGGVREKQMADEVKVMVRRKATERREKKWGLLPTVSDLSPHAQAQAQPRGESQSADHPMGGAGGPSPSVDGSGDLNPLSTGTATSAASPSLAGTSTASSPPSLDGSLVRPTTDSFPENKSEIEVTFTMIYLDYVVPFLFPFYRPCLLESSRGWMLLLLMKNRALFHTALSLANWLYSVILDSMDGAHGSCKQANWSELQAHQEIAIQALQEDIQALNERGVANAFRECISCMQSVIQLLEFEIANQASTSNWQVHHDAAVVLFDQVLTNHVTTADGSVQIKTDTPWMHIMERIGYPFQRIPIGADKRVLTSDQSAWRFYTAYLVWVDIIAATATGDVPRLRKYHAELLHGEKPRISLAEYVGCHSWAMLELTEVAGLAAWKRAQQSSGSLSMMDLVRRACAIDTRLRQKMETLDLSHGDRASNIYDPSAHHPVTPYAGFVEMGGGAMPGFNGMQQSPAADLHTRIWAQATITYLHVIALGLQPTLPEIRVSVEATIELLRALASPLAVRTLVWPFAVTGCLALPEQEPFFVELVTSMGAFQVFGTVKEALNIMQNVWQHRNTGCIDPQMWDLATCFSLLGHCSLLV